VIWPPVCGTLPTNHASTSETPANQGKVVRTTENAVEVSDWTLPDQFS
jgi:hypothetical protein